MFYSHSHRHNLLCQVPSCGNVHKFYSYVRTCYTCHVTCVDSSAECGCFPRSCNKSPWLVAYSSGVEAGEGNLAYTKCPHYSYRNGGGGGGGVLEGCEASSPPVTPPCYPWESCIPWGVGRSGEVCLDHSRLSRVDLSLPSTGAGAEGEGHGDYGDYHSAEGGGGCGGDTRCCCWWW